jgi:hypothetical protein
MIQKKESKFVYCPNWLRLEDVHSMFDSITEAVLKKRDKRFIRDDGYVMNFEFFADKDLKDNNIEFVVNKDGDNTISVYIPIKINYPDEEQMRCEQKWNVNEKTKNL